MGPLDIRKSKNYRLRFGSARSFEFQYIEHVSSQMSRPSDLWALYERIYGWKCSPDMNGHRARGRPKLISPDREARVENEIIIRDGQGNSLKLLTR